MAANLEQTNLKERERIYGGKIIAEGVSYEDYLAGKYGIHAEWVYGVVIAMSPISEQHDSLSRFLSALFDTYLELTTGGRVLQEPMVMKPAPDLPGREPDLQVLLPDRMHLLQNTQVAGPANLVVEIISPESGARDRGEKFHEYERGGVDEYWLLDPLRKESQFYVREEDGLFHNRLVVDGIYTSSVLPKLRLHVNTLWQEKLPTTRETVQLVEQILAGYEP
ncbi:MAG: Uma2 family endonuclease [Anaerolineaceae bacterium]|nr:Uma2 family endonuclease [Anaerolineaceae bacterium]